MFTLLEEIQVIVLVPSHEKQVSMIRKYLNSTLQTNTVARGSATGQYQSQCTSKTI